MPLAAADAISEKRRILETIAGEIGRGELSFPTSSQLALRLRHTLDDPDCDVGTAARLIQADPLLAARIVALANSALFNRSGRAIADVHSAVSRLGFSVVRSLATALVARQIAGAPAAPEHGRMAAELWDHTTHVAALACVLARRVTRQDPDTAMFAGLMHEVGGFYLLSRVGDFPGLLDGPLLSDWTDDGEAEPASGGDAGNSGRRSFESRIGHAILESLAVPAAVLQSIETVWQGYLTLPSETLGDTVLLADALAPVKSPFDRAPQGGARKTPASLDMMVEGETLLDILEEAAGEVESLARILRQ